MLWLLARQVGSLRGALDAAAMTSQAARSAVAAFGWAAKPCSRVRATPPAGGAGPLGGAVARAHVAVLTGGIPAPAGGVLSVTVVPLRDMALLALGIALRRVTSTGFGAVDVVSAVFGGGHAGYDTGGEAFSQVASGSTDDARALAVTRDYEDVRLSVSR